jgi:cation diffusion facilitator CzcD-associated flavoprotein CzcO
MKAIIIGAGISGLELGRNLSENGDDNYLILEKNSSVYKNNSWKTLGSLVDNFGLSDCVINNVSNLHMRTFDLNTKEVFFDYVVSADNYINIDDRAVILDSSKVYDFYNNILKDNILLNAEVNSIKKKKGSFVVTTSNGEKFRSDYIVDASGVSNILSFKILL